MVTQYTNASSHHFSGSTLVRRGSGQQQQQQLQEQHQQHQRVHGNLHRGTGASDTVQAASSSASSKTSSVPSKTSGLGLRRDQVPSFRRRESETIDVMSDVKSLPAHSSMTATLSDYLAACRVFSVDPDPCAAMAFNNLRRTSHLHIDPETFDPLGMLPLCEVLKQQGQIPAARKAIHADVSANAAGDVQHKGDDTKGNMKGREKGSDSKGNDTKSKEKGKEKGTGKGKEKGTGKGKGEGEGERGRESAEDASAQALALLTALPPCPTSEPCVVRSLDLSGCRIGSNGCYVLQGVLERNHHLEEIRLEYCGIDHRGAKALATSLENHPSVTLISVRGNDIGESGALALAGVALRSGTLTVLDVSNNCAGTVAVDSLVSVCCARDGSLLVEHGGNSLHEEVLNSVTHFVGLIAFAVAGWILTQYASNVSTAYYVSSQIYAWSLVFMFLSSTGCHSTFMLPITGAVFRALDHCSIYLLIAGTYTPLMAVTLGHTWTGTLTLALVWIIALVGISFTLIESQGWSDSPVPTVYLALAQGWCAVLIARPLAECLDPWGTFFLAAGGVAYSVGVVWFIRGLKKAIFHVWWHIAVLVGATLHFVCVFQYVGESCDVELF